MKFSKLSLAAGILLGITGLVSCNAVKTESDYDHLSDVHTATSGADCISDGSGFEKPQESGEIVESRQREDDEAGHGDVGCILDPVTK